MIGTENGGRSMVEPSIDVVEAGSLVSLPFWSWTLPVTGMNARGSRYPEGPALDCKVINSCRLRWACGTAELPALPLLVPVIWFA